MAFFQRIASWVFPEPAGLQETRQARELEKTLLLRREHAHVEQTGEFVRWLRYLEERDSEAVHILNKAVESVVKAESKDVKNGR